MVLADQARRSTTSARGRATSGQELTGGRTQAVPAQGAVQEADPHCVPMTYGSETNRGPVCVTASKSLAEECSEELMNYIRSITAASPRVNTDTSGALKTLHRRLPCATKRGVN